MGAAELVAILFTDVVGSTEAVARFGDRRADELRQAYFALLREGIRAHRGEEVKNLGDGLMVAFGSASDAVACAVAMQHALARHNRRGGEPVVMRMGVAVGEAAKEDGDYFGTPVIQASRLCARAEGGEILVTEMAQALAGTRIGWRFASLGAVELKGLPVPVPVHRVLWEDLDEDGPPLPPRLGSDRLLTFIGRTAELEVLEGAWKRSQEGVLQVVLVAGEPGIGKTRLATEAALHAHRQGGVVLLGRCDEDLAVPYQPFVEALHHLVTVCPEEVLARGLAERGGELTRLVPELSRHVLGLGCPQSADPETGRYLLFSSVATLLESISRWRSVLLMLDDLHWATKPTLLLLKHLIRSSEPMALLIVGTYRDSDIGRGHPLTDLLAELRRDPEIERLKLRGLSDSDAVTMMETLAGHGLEGAELALAHAVHAEADGSPLFMREILRHFIERGELRHEGDRWTFQGQLSDIPDSVREVIDHRLSRLPEPVDRLLALAAVIGLEFDVDVLSRLASLDRSVVIDALADARRAALVREVQDAPGRYTFVHALIRRTLYEELGGAQQMELHRRVAETFESLAAGDAYVSDLAHHWLEAVPKTPVSADVTAKAARYAEQAGRRAMASLAYEEAAHYFAGALRAAGHTGDGTRICELLILLGEAQRCAGDPTHRETLLAAGRQALKLNDADRATRAALANQRGVFSRIGFVDGERVAALEAALAAVGPAHTAVRARLLASLSTELHFEGEERRLALATEALNVAREVDDPATLAQALAAACLAAWGSTAQAMQGPAAAELNELAGRLGDRTLEFHAGVALFYSATGHGDMDRADEALALCTRIADELGQPTLGWRVTHLQMHRAMAAGRFDDVERWSAEAWRLGEATGQPDSLPYSRGALVVTRLLQGRPQEAEALVAPLAERFPTAIYLGLKAWAGVERGEVDEPRAILARLRGSNAFGSLPCDHHRPVALCVLSWVCYRLEDAEIAAELYDLLLPYQSTTINGQTAWIGPASHHLALLATILGRYDEAEEHFSDAVQRQDRMGAKGTVVNTRLAWATMLRRRDAPGDGSRARRLLEAAKTGAQAVGIPDIEASIDAMLAG